MSRVQLALNVTDLAAAIDFYSKLFGTGPAKVRPGYANFAVVEPPLKLVLIEGQGAGGSVNHLGVEVESSEDVATAQDRLAAHGLTTATEAAVTCCYAVQDKVWVHGPDGEPWEVYTVLADAEMPAGQLRATAPAACGPGACSDTTAPVDAADAADAAACCDAAVTQAVACCDERVTA